MMAVGTSFMYTIYIYNKNDEAFFLIQYFFCFFPLYMYNGDPVNRKKDDRLGE